jgi:succinoglycan biosynthesis transport protein ExoP
VRSVDSKNRDSVQGRPAIEAALERNAREPDSGRDIGPAAVVSSSKIVPRTLVKSAETVILSQPDSVAAERFRRLKTKLVNEYKSSVQVLAVTSPSPSDGKSLVAMNLALAWAGDGETTLLVDADLRRPNVGHWLSTPPTFGFVEVVMGEIGLDQAVLSFKETPLQILPVGRFRPDAPAVLSSPACRELLSKLRERYQRIIVDTPPIVLFSDADIIGPLADGVLMVARGGATAKAAYVNALSLVTSTRVLGTVLNDVTFNLADPSSYYGDHYKSYYDKGRRH